MDLAWITLLGGVLALDATSVGQFMLSRPLVAGALAGWVLGDPVAGLTIGALLEVYLLVSFPSGGARFPDGTTATVVAVAAAAASASPGALPLAVAFGLAWGHLGGYTVTWVRKANGHLVPEPTDTTATVGRVVGAQLGGVALDFSRAALVTLGGATLGRALVARSAAAWPLTAAASTGLLLVGAAVSIGIFLHDLGGFKRHRLLFAAGLALGVAGARLL